MKKEKKEVLSRREFFKKAAKGALPILGAILMASMPSIANAEKNNCSVPMGCSEYNCHGGCKNGCGGCDATCVGGCKNYACKGVAKN